MIGLSLSLKKNEKMTMTMKKVKVVQIGTSHPHAMGIMKTIKELNDIYEIVGIVETNDHFYEKAKKNPIYYDIKRLCLEDVINNKDIEAAIIETDEKELVSCAKKMLEAGFHVHMDKPGGENHNEFCDMIKVAKTRKLVFHMGYMYRYNPAVKECMEMINTGIIGNPICVEAQMNIKLESDTLKKYCGGMMYFLGCHMLDIVVSIMGEPKMIIPFSHSTCLSKTDALDYGMVILKYDNGVSFVKSSAVEINGFIRRQIVVTGTKGTINIQPIEEFDRDNPNYLKCNLNVTLESDNPSACFDGSRKFNFPKYTRYGTMMAEFAEYVRGHKNNPYTYEHEMMVNKVIMKSSLELEEKIKFKTIGS